VVPTEHVPVIMGWLRPAEHTREPWTLSPWDELGQIVIRTRDGQELRVQFYWAGKNPAVLTPNGEDRSGVAVLTSKVDRSTAASG
jgi:hypothetical protein